MCKMKFQFLLITMILTEKEMALGNDESQKNLKIKGNVSLELDFSQNENMGDGELEADIKIQSRRIEGWRAEVALKGESDDRQLRLKEALANWSSKSLRFSIGLIEQHLGLESIQNKWERHFDSLLYRKFKETGLIGEELGMRLFSASDTWSVTLGLPDSKDYNIRVAYNASVNKKLTMLVNTMIGSDYWYQGERQTIYAVSAGLMTANQLSDEEPFTWEIEAAYGVDPIASEWSKIAGQSGLTHFKSARGGLRIPTNFRVSDSPVWSLVDLAIIEHNDSKHTVTAGDGGLGIMWFKEDWQIKSHIKRKVDSYQYPDYKTQKSYDWYFDLTFLVRI